MKQQYTEREFLGCNTEYNPLIKVILCQPQYMKIREVINETQAHFAEEGIDTSLAMKQHQNLVATLEREGVEVILLPATKKYPEQVFTRDLAFAYGNTVVIGMLEEAIRKGEEHILRDWLEDEGIPYLSITAGPIEGGDVLIDEGHIWVGDSYRTSKEAVNELRKLLPNVEIHMVPFNGDYLHLDCVFNLVSPTEGLIFPDAFEPKPLADLKKRFDLIEVSAEEQFTLGTNVLSLGNKKVLSLPVNKQVNAKLRERGYTVIEVDITEIIKSGGSFRCVTMPILRQYIVRK